MPSAQASSVTFRRVPASLKRAAIERFARTLQKEIGKGRPFDTLISGDAELRRLNREFRGKDYPTDVLSFPAGEKHTLPTQRVPRRVSDGIATLEAETLQAETRPLGNVPSLGDIAISLGRARAQAREFGHTIEQEIHILMLHGVLHLVGHDHETDSGAMARAEKRWRAKFGLPGALIERVGA